MNNDDTVKIPNWLKGNVREWSLGQIDDNTFSMTIQYLISKGIVKI